MRDLTSDELTSVSGGTVNSNKQITVVKAVNTSVSVKSVVVQRNGETLVNYTRVIRR